MGIPRIFLALFLTFSTICQAQKLNFHHLGPADGLSQNSVLTIQQDSKGFMWFGTRSGLNRFDSRHFKVYKYAARDTAGISCNYIISSLLDSKGNLWFGTVDGLNRYNEGSDTFTRFAYNPQKPEGLSDDVIYSIFQDKRGAIWVGTGKGLNLLTDPKRGLFAKFLDRGSETQCRVRSVTEDGQGNILAGTSEGLYKVSRAPGGYRASLFATDSTGGGSLTDKHITCVASDPQGNLWVGTMNGGLNVLRKGERVFRHYRWTGSAATGPLSNYIRNILFDRSGKVWLATMDGISIVNPVDMRFQGYQNDVDDDQTLSNNSVFSLFQDNAGSIWAGTYRGGVNVIYGYTTPFSTVTCRKTGSGLSHSSISAIAEDADRNLWIGTEGNGLNFYNRKSKTFQHYHEKAAAPYRIPTNAIKCIKIDKKGVVWVGTYLAGLCRIDPAGRRITSHRSLSGDASAQTGDNVQAIIVDRRGRIWIGTEFNGVGIFDADGAFVSKIDTGSVGRSLGSNMVGALMEDAEGNILVGTSYGLDVFGVNGKNRRVPFHSVEDPAGAHFSVVTVIFQDSQKRIWVAGNYRGISLYDPINARFTNFIKKDGLASDNIHGILEDSKGTLWLSSDNGISRFDPRTRRVLNYDISDGLPTKEMTPAAFCRTRDGQLLFGSNRGLVRFYPDSIQINNVPPVPVLTGLRLFGKPVIPHDSTELLNAPIGQTAALHFRHDQNIFTIDFAVLNFVRPEKNRYAYKLEGFEENWNYADIPAATYTNLSPGDYVLLVNGASNDGIWGKQPLRITIQVSPPLWQTWWAYCLYALLLSSAVFMVGRFFLMRTLLKQEHELHQAKLDFFTNISHEIRTHLTLTLGPVEKVLLAHANDNGLRRDLGPVQSNGQRLLGLMNELMDFRKAESKSLVLRASVQNIVPFLREIFESLSHLAETGRIQTRFIAASDRIELAYDAVQMEKVIYNLLVNAFKFTPEGGKVWMKVVEEPGAVMIQVHDTGRGIAPAHLKKLFVNFFQVYEYGSQNTGYGIGLALSKSIVEQHHGTLTVESVTGNETAPGHTVFSVRLLTGTDHLPIEPPLPTKDITRVAGEQHSQSVFDETIQEDAPLILIVEDHPEVREFIAEIVGARGHCRVIFAGNGADGLEMAFESLPDLVISDIMMDPVDGLQLCEVLKSDARTSHIPVILLTAKTSTRHQIEGLRTGADAYVMKPFSIEILTLTMDNLFNARQVMREKFSRQVTLEPRQQVINTLDERFIDDVIRMTEDNLDNPDFGVGAIVREVGMSRGVLYKKLRTLTGMSVNDFIKSIRLKKAAQLLASGELNVNEVTIAVGYDDRKYFRQEFKKQFGVNPSEYTAQN